MGNIIRHICEIFFIKTKFFFDFFFLLNKKQNKTKVIFLVKIHIKFGELNQIGGSLEIRYNHGFSCLLFYRLFCV